MYEQVQLWLAEHETLVWVLVASSVATFLGSLIAMPWILAQLPTDFFTDRGRWIPGWSQHHPLLRWVVRVAKSVIGAVLILVGIALLALPGQGLLTIAVGLLLLEFPGKHRLIAWIGRRRSVRRGLNWIRTRMGRAPFEDLPPNPE